MVVWFSFGYKPGIFGTHANDVLSFDRYVEALSPTFFATFQNTLWIGIAGTVLCLVIGLPVAYWMAVKAPPSRRGLLLALVMVPFWTNFLVRTIGWQVILAPEGWLSTLLQASDSSTVRSTSSTPAPAVLIGVVYNYLPLMILPLFVAFDRVNGPLREASKDLGAGRWTTFVRVTLPLARPGHHRRRAAGLHPAHGRLHHRHGARRREGQHGRPARGEPVPDRPELGARLGDGGAAHHRHHGDRSGVGALVVWLVSMPFRSRNRLVLGDPPAPTPAAVNRRRRPSRARRRR